MLPFRRFAFFLAALAPAATSVQAGQVHHTANAGSIPVNGTASLSFPDFDGGLGVLREVRVFVSTHISGTHGFENTTSQPVTIGGFASNAGVAMLLPVSLPGGTMSAPNPSFIPPQSTLAAYDGITDQHGGSGITWAFTNASGDGFPSMTQFVFDDAGLAAYVGTGSGTLTITLGPTIQQGPQLPPGIVAATSMTADAFVSLRYDYDPFPTAICRGRPGSGCPCGNVSLQNRGCGNSVNAGGGALTATGVASIANDTLVLAGDGMTPGSPALYFQGTSFQYAQSVYGDGLRCVTGTLVRLGAKQNSAGASSYPQGADPSVSVRGGVVAPGTRFYQVSYRDVGSYCTPSLFNATSGVAIRWEP